MSEIKLTPFQKRVISEIQQFCQEVNGHVLKLGFPLQCPGFTVAIVKSSVSILSQAVRPRVILFSRWNGMNYLNLFHVLEASAELWPEIWTSEVFSEILPDSDICLVDEANQLDLQLMDFLQKSTKKLILCYRTSEVPFSEAPYASIVYHSSSSKAQTPSPAPPSNKPQFLVKGPSEN